MVLDSGFVPNTSTKMMSGFLEQEMINNKTTCFSPLHNSGFCLTGNHYYTESSSSMVAVAELLRSGGVGGQPTQVVVTHLEKKRKTMGSKVDGEGKCKKEKKCSDDGMSKNGEEKKIKAERKNKKKKKAPQEPPIGGYVHVRARRGQATDSHSLAERVRREKISERMRLLQSLVPGCDKMTGKALILEEIINYVQCLQNQVQVLLGIGEIIASRSCPKVLLLNGIHDRETSGFSAACFVTAIADALNRTYGDPYNCLKNHVSLKRFLAWRPTILQCNGRIGGDS